jgi:uncharacterized protein (DUF3084 family)
MSLAKVSAGGLLLSRCHHGHIDYSTNFISQHLQDMLNNRDASIVDLEKGIATAEERLKESEQKLREAESTRRKLHNTILARSDLVQGLV